VEHPPAHLDVEVHDPVPTLALGDLVVLGAPGRAAIVDDDVELADALLDLDSEDVAAGLAAEVGDDIIAGARSGGLQLGGERLEVLLLARGLSEGIGSAGRP
jgi:hypothetical protein